jgi:hypothetical protein
MSQRTDHLTDEAITQFLRTRSADPDLALLSGIMDTVGAARQDRPWLWLRPIVLPRRTLLIVAVALLVAAMGAVAVGSGLLLPAMPEGPFEGTWISTSDADGGTQTMTVAISADGAVEMTVRDTIATVCGRTPSTMTGSGRIEDSNTLVIPSPLYTCDDGSEPQALSGPPLQEQLRDWTLFLDPQTDTLSDSIGGVWRRPGAEVPSRTKDPLVNLKPVWPQTSLEEVREAQELADDGDPRYTWQVLGLGPLTDARQTDFITRFLQEELGWEEFDVSVFPGLYAGVVQDGLWEMLAVRCAPGQTNPLYPDDPEGGGCAPTIDEHRYETVIIGAEPARPDDPSSIWVVSRWVMLQPSDVQVTGINYRVDSGPVVRRQVQQVVPASDAEATALLETLLQARVDGEGAEAYLSPSASQIPLLYATTSDAPYERSEFELVQGPVWPGGWREFTVRLFAAGGSTVVEQSFLVDRDEDGRLVLVHGALDPGKDVLTTENGGALAEPYEFLDGEVTFAAAPPWDWYVGGWGFTPTMTTLEFGDSYQLLAVVADPLPVETGCEDGRAPADAEALARSIRSDPDLEATEPVAVSIGGIDALRMDVVAATGASVCGEGGHPQVLAPAPSAGPNGDLGWIGVGLRHGDRMRLYLLDLPEGMSARILAIAISAPEPDFERVVEAAAPVLDSIEFHAP